jgi:hypothetical protein
MDFRRLLKGAAGMNESRFVTRLSEVALFFGLSLAIMGCSPAEDEPPNAAADFAPPTPESVSPAIAAEAPNCCSCAFVTGKTYADPRLPCLFDYPQPWQAVTGDDGALVSTVAGPPTSCGTICKNGSPTMSVSYGTTYDSNADEMESIWQMAMPIVGDARCGEGTVRFFSPPGADETGFLGGVKFYVKIDGKNYGGAAQFACGQPGGWLRLRDMFIESFRDNPESTYPGT